MRINVNEIVRRVYALLDENESILEERVEYGDPGTMLRPLILDLLPDAARITLCAAPFGKIDDCVHLKSLRPSTDGMTTLELPSDFLRLVYVRMADWRGGVRTPLAWGGPDYHLRLRRQGRRDGGRMNPAVAIRCSGERKILEIFGSLKGMEVAELEYVAVPEIKGSFIELPPALVHDVATKTAEMVRCVIQ